LIVEKHIKTAKYNEGAMLFSTEGQAWEMRDCSEAG